MGSLKNFFENAKSLGIGYAFDCASAEAEYNMSVKLFEAKSKRLAKKLPEDVEYLDDEPKSIAQKHGLAKSKTAAKKGKCDAPKKEEDDEEEIDEDEDLLEESIPEDLIDPELLPSVIEKMDDTINDGDLITIGAMNQDDVLENLDAATTELSDIDAREVKLTILSLLYISCLIRSDQVYKELDHKTGDADIVFINSMTDALMGIGFNYRFETDKLENQISSIKNLLRICKFEAKYKPTCAELEGCIEKVKEYAKKKTKTEDGEVSEVVTPVQFTGATPNPQAPKISKKEISTLEQLFGETLDGKRYEFHKIGEIYALTTFDANGMPLNYNIDPGFIFGNGVSMLVVVYGNLLPINIVSNRPVIRKFLDNHMTIPTQKEMTDILKNLMSDFRIYMNIDMSRGNEILPKLTKTQYNEFQLKLRKIISLNWEGSGIAMPRMRIKSFKSVDQFTLVSDEKVKIPPLIGFNYLINKLELSVKGDEVYVSIGDRTIYADLSIFKASQNTPQMQQAAAAV